MSDVRQAAADALGQIADQSAVNVLSDAAKGDENPNVRLAASTAIRQIGGTAAVESLRTADNERMRAVCIRFLGELGGRKAVQELKKYLTPNLNRGATLEDGKTVYLNELAAEALTHIGTPEALQGVEDYRRERAK